MYTCSVSCRMPCLAASLVDRVSSSARTLYPVGGRSFQILRSAGLYVFGDEGRRYVDTAMGFGRTILGHAHTAVVEACTAALGNGPLPAFSHPGEERAAQAVIQQLGPLGRVIFTNSGSEAVHLAARIACTVTGRPRIAKMAASSTVGWTTFRLATSRPPRQASMTSNAPPTAG